MHFAPHSYKKFSIIRGHQAHETRHQRRRLRVGGFCRRLTRHLLPSFSVCNLLVVGIYRPYIRKHRVKYIIFGLVSK